MGMIQIERGVGRYRDKIASALSEEPKTANEIAKELNLNQRTVQVELMRLALTRPDEIGYKQIGRTHLFWKKAKK
jgi:predicted ArsR family transcriptional regulator